MKKKTKLIGIACLLLCAFFLQFSCKKKQSDNPIENLPAATQEGKNTFGCLVNGKVFVPKKNAGSTAIPLEFNAGTTFQIRATDFVSNQDEVRIVVKNMIIKVGSEYILNDPINAFGVYEIFKNSSPASYKTSSSNTGMLKITRYDSANLIISGTFSFDAINTAGEKVEVRDGRFDIKF